MDVLFIIVSFAVSGRGLPVDPILADNTFQTYEQCETELYNLVQTSRLFTQSEIESRKDGKIRVVTRIGSGKKFTYCLGPILR